MKLIIDIPDELYRILKRNEADIRRSHDALKLTVIDGTVLPIGHGRLIDADYIKLFLIDHDSWNGVEYEGVIKVVPVIAIDNAPTIIEADKETENEHL